MEDADRADNINHQLYDYYDEFNDNCGKNRSKKKECVTVADNIKYNKRLEDTENEYERKQRLKEEDKNYEKHKRKLEHFHIKNEDPMYNMLEDKKLKFDESKELVKMYLQALLDDYRYKQYKHKRKNHSSKSKKEKSNKKPKIERYPKSKYESSSESDSESNSSSSSSSD